MEQIVLEATERVKKSKKFKEEGFIPGVVYGDTIAKAESVKFEEVPFKKILAQHGSNVKLFVKLGDNKKLGFIKEIQKHPVTNKIIHVDVQLVSKDHEIKAQVHINFKGEDKLRSKLLQLQVHKSEVDVLGKIDLIPELISVDVSEKALGDTITLKDFDLDKQLKIHDKTDEIYANVTKIVEVIEEETEETETEVAEVAATEA